MNVRTDGGLTLDVLETSGADAIRLSGDVYRLGESLKARLEQHAWKIRSEMAEKLRAEMVEHFRQEGTAMRVRLLDTMNKYFDELPKAGSGA